MRDCLRRIVETNERRCLVRPVRLAWLAIALFAVTAARLPPPLPVPPIPPARPPADSNAPIPNPDVTAPTPTASLSPSFMVHDFRINTFDRSLGYVPGSHFSTSEDKRPIQTPGLEMKVPLQ